LPVTESLDIDNDNAPVNCTAQACRMSGVHCFLASARASAVAKRDAQDSEGSAALCPSAEDSDEDHQRDGRHGDHSRDGYQLNATRLTAAAASAPVAAARRRSANLITVA
jgi:hypothetical protein